MARNRAPDRAPADRRKAEAAKRRGSSFDFVSSSRFRARSDEVIDEPLQGKIAAYSPQP